MRRTRLSRGPTGDTLHWWCPGCDMPHAAPVTGERHWNWNGIRESPTLSPSVLCRWTNPELPDEVCHCFVREGVIQFLGDCTHSLANQTAPIPDWPAGRYETVMGEVLEDLAADSEGGAS